MWKGGILTTLPLALYPRSRDEGQEALEMPLSTLCPFLYCLIRLLTPNPDSVLLDGRNPGTMLLKMRSLGRQCQPLLGTCWKMQILRLHPRPGESETDASGARNQCSVKIFTG